MLSLFFDNWDSVGRVLLVGPLAYILLVLMLRVTGKRTLSKMNAFDLVVTVALGSALATTMLSKNAALAEGIAAMGLLILMQFAVTWLSVRSEQFQSVVKAQPILLMHRGFAIRDALIQERVSQEEILAAIRSSGLPTSDDCSVVLETDGSLSVIAKRADEEQSSLANVSPTAGVSVRHRTRGEQ